MDHSISLRLARGEDDLEFLSALARHPAVEPFLSPGAWERNALSALLARDPQPHDGPTGPYVIERSGERLGGLALAVTNRRSGICELARVMIRPDARRAQAGLEAVTLAAHTALLGHDLHRLQAEVYGDNPAGQHLFERAGFTREGIRRRAYWRRDQWLDGILYGLLAEELQRPCSSTASPP